MLLLIFFFFFQKYENKNGTKINETQKLIGCQKCESQESGYGMGSGGFSCLLEDKQRF